MSTAKRLALIAAGYVFAVAAGLAAAAINDMRMPADVAQGSPGMVAFGDMILLVLVAGFFSLAPTWFLLRLLVKQAPRTLVALELVVAALGPASWLAVTSLAAGPPKLPQAIGQLAGLFVAFCAVPRMVLGPVVLVIEGVTFILIRERTVRALLVVAMLMDIVPLGLFAVHMARMARY